MLAHADAVAERLAQAGAQVAEHVAARRDAARGRLPQRAGPRSSRPPSRRLRDARPEPDRSRSSRTPRRDNGAAVADGTLHVAVCFQDATLERHEPSGTERHELGDEPMLAMVAATHPLAGEARIALRCARGRDLDHPWRESLVRRACVSAGFEPHIAFVCRDPLAIGALVARGLAVTLVPRLLASAGRLDGVAILPLERRVPPAAALRAHPGGGLAAGQAMELVAALRGDVLPRSARPSAARGRRGANVEHRGIEEAGCGGAARPRVRGTGSTGLPDRVGIRPWATDPRLGCLAGAGQRSMAHRISTAMSR